MYICIYMCVFLNKIYLLCKIIHLNKFIFQLFSKIKFIADACENLKFYRDDKNAAIKKDYET